MANEHVRTEMMPTGDTAGSLIRDGKTIQQIQTKYQTAVAIQLRRNLVDVEKRCVDEARLAGAVCFYGWGAGKNRVEGPSKDLAFIASRNWGNCAVDMAPVHETNASWIFTAYFIDLETGYTYPRQFRQSKKFTVYGKMDAERKDDIRFQIGQSKCQRNAILNALPAWLIDKMMDEAKKGVREKLERFVQKNGIELARKGALEAFVKFGVSEDMIEQKYGKKYNAWDVDLLVVFQGDISALTSGAESADTLFPTEPEESVAKPSGLSIDDMTAGDVTEHQDVRGKAEEKTSTTSGKSGVQTEAGF